jgi:hypothetical protein
MNTLEVTQQKPKLRDQHIVGAHTPFTLFGLQFTLFLAISVLIAKWYFASALAGIRSGAHK